MIAFASSQPHAGTPSSNIKHHGVWQTTCNLTMVALKHLKLPIRSTKNTTSVSQQQLSSLPFVGAPLAISNSRLTKFLPSPVVSQLPGPTQFKENARPLELKAKADLKMSGMSQKVSLKLGWCRFGVDCREQENTPFTMPSTKQKITETHPVISFPLYHVILGPSPSLTSIEMHPSQQISSIIHRGEGKVSQLNPCSKELPILEIAQVAGGRSLGWNQVAVAR